MDVAGMATFNDATAQLPVRYMLSADTFTTPGPFTSPTEIVAGPQLEAGIIGRSAVITKPTLLSSPVVNVVGVNFQVAPLFI